jgi:hypothetical protein
VEFLLYNKGKALKAIRFKFPFFLSPPTNIFPQRKIEKKAKQKPTQPRNSDGISLFLLLGFLSFLLLSFFERTAMHSIYQDPGKIEGPAATYKVKSKQRDPGDMMDSPLTCLVLPTHLLHRKRRREKKGQKIKKKGRRRR